MTYEEYALGELYLGYFNGADEGNFIVATGSLFGFIFGNDFWINKLGFFGLNITVGQFIFVLVFIGSLLTCSFSCLLKILFRKGFKRFLICLYDAILFYNVFIFPALYLYLNKDGYRNYLSLIMITVSLLYARITIELHITICTSNQIKFNYDIYISNFIISINYIIYNNLFLLFSLSITSIILGIYLIGFIYIRGNEILNYLNINLLTIKIKS